MNESLIDELIKAITSLSTKGVPGWIVGALLLLSYVGYGVFKAVKASQSKKKVSKKKIILDHQTIDQIQNPDIKESQSKLEKWKQKILNRGK